MAPLPPITAAQQSALDLLRQSERVLLTGHERPDGDCVGSQVALARCLEALGRSARIVLPDPIEPRHAFLVEGVELEVWNGGELFEHDLCVLLDASDLGRTGPLAPALAAAPSRKLVVDHHVSHGGHVHAAFHDATCAATGLLVRRIAHALGAPLDRIAARALFASLVTDTGWFRHPNSDPESFDAARELVALGALPHEIHERLHQGRSAGHPALVAAALSSVEYRLDGRLALMLVGGAAGTRLDAQAVEDALDLVRSVGTVEVVLLAREARAGEWRLSARSKTAFDVSELALHFGGGGHARASGATLAGSADEVRERLAAAAVPGLQEPSLLGEGRA